MNIARRLLLVLLISIFLFGCSGNKATTEGKLVDGKGQPIAGITVIFKQVKPTADTEQLEAKTGADGIFRLSGLISSSEYIITPVSDKWKTNVTMKITTGREGQTMVLTNPIVIRFNLLANGTVIDTKTGLQWLIYTATDLKAGDVLSTVKNFREGGFSDWRLPSKADILGLQENLASTTAQSEAESARQTCCVWVAEPNSEKVEWEFYVDDGNELWSSGKMPPNDRVIVIRNYSASSTTAQVPIAAAPTVVVPQPQAAASPSPADVTAPAVPEKKDAPPITEEAAAPEKMKQPIPAVKPTTSAPAAKPAATTTTTTTSPAAKPATATTSPAATAPAPAKDDKAAVAAVIQAAEKEKVDMTGTWNLSVITPRGPGSPDFILKQEGNKLTGDYSGTFGTASVTGAVQGRNFEMKYKMGGRTDVYKGKVDGNQMSGNIDFGGQETGTFTGKKK